MSYKFETRLESLARMISKKFGINIIFSGEECCTDGNNIYLPYIHNLDDVFAKKLHGYLNHEVGHINFTDFTQWYHRAVKNSVLKDVTNVLEDIRIEAQMMEKYPGTYYNISPMREELNEKHMLILPNPNKSIVDRIIFAIQLHIQGYAIDFNDNELNAFFNPIKKLLTSFNECSSTEEIIDLSEKIVKYIQKEVENQEQKNKEKSQESNSEDSKDNNNNNNNQNKNQSNKDNPKDNQNSDSDSENDDSSPEEKTIDDNQNSSNKKTEQNDSPTPSKEIKTNGELNDNQLAEIKGQLHKKEGQKKGQLSSFDLTNEINELLKDVIKSDVKKILASTPPQKNGKITLNKNLVGIPVTTQFDELNDLSKVSDISSYLKSKKEISNTIIPIKTKLEQLLKIKEDDRWVNDRESGEINEAVLSNFLIDKNFSTPFKERHKNETTNVSVGILIDQSNSMSGQKIELAKQTAIALGEALNGLRISCEISGFHSEDCKEIVPMFNQLSPQRKLVSIRNNEKFIFNVFKKFDSDNLSGISNLYSSGCTPDAEAVKMAGERLLQRIEKRKILFVLSDGAPFVTTENDDIPHNDLKLKISQLEKLGVEVVAFGIQTSSVARYYNNYVIVNDIRTLPKVCVKELSKLLLKNMNKR